MAQYKIVNATDSSVVSHNSRELKRRIKSSAAKYKKYTAGFYYYINRKGKKCFQVEYTLTDGGKVSTLVGKQSNIKN